MQQERIQVWEKFSGEFRDDMYLEMQIFEEFLEEGEEEEDQFELQEISRRKKVLRRKSNRKKRKRG
jgi:hypothetical protein